jgi:hydroxyacylglutathione hydrolase
VTAPFSCGTVQAEILCAHQEKALCFLCLCRLALACRRCSRHERCGEIFYSELAKLVMLEIVSFTLGPVQTNAYLVADSETHNAAVIDPAWDGHIILEEAQKRGWRIAHLWYTHAHFDHIGGAGEIADGLNPLPLVALHPNDHVLWRASGGGPMFGFNIDPGPEPMIDLYQGQILRLGSVEFEVRFTPGHTTGHCIFYVADTRADWRSRVEARSDALSLSKGRSVCFCGDLIFHHSVGRTDLPGGDWDALVNSIKTQVFTLPDETHLLSGHGPETTVGEEKKFNPFVGNSSLGQVL